VAPVELVASGLEGASKLRRVDDDGASGILAGAARLFTPAREEADSRLFMPMGGGGGKLDQVAGETRTMIPVYRVPGWEGTITRLRLRFDNQPPRNSSSSPSIRVRHAPQHQQRELHSRQSRLLRVDTRPHLPARTDRAPAPALRFMEREFDTRKRRCVYTTWPGHEGRSGVRYVDGKKQIIQGEGIGSNYWTSSRSVARMPWLRSTTRTPSGTSPTSRRRSTNTRSGALPPAPRRSIRRTCSQHADAVQRLMGSSASEHTTGRFGTVDLDGRSRLRVRSS